MVATDNMCTIRRLDPPSGSNTGIEGVVSKSIRYTDPQYTSDSTVDRVSLSRTARKIINDEYGLMKTFQMTPEDYQISKKEEAILNKEMPDRIDDYKAILRVMEEHNYIIVANMKDQGTTNCYVAKSKLTPVSGPNGKIKQVYGRNEKFMRMVLGSKNFDEEMKKENGEYKNPADVNLNELHNVEFYKNEFDAKTDLNSTYGFGMKWCYCPSKK